MGALAGRGCGNGSRSRLSTFDGRRYTPWKEQRGGAGRNSGVAGVRPSLVHGEAAMRNSGGEGPDTGLRILLPHALSTKLDRIGPEANRGSSGRLHSDPPRSAGQNRRPGGDPRRSYRRLRPGASRQAERRPNLAGIERKRRKHPWLRNVRRNRAHDLANSLQPTASFAAAIGRHARWPVLYVSAAAGSPVFRKAASRSLGRASVAAHGRRLLANGSLLPAFIRVESRTARDRTLLHGRNRPLSLAIHARKRRRVEGPDSGRSFVLSSGYHRFLLPPKSRWRPPPPPPADRSRRSGGRASFTTSARPSN